MLESSPFNHRLRRAYFQVNQFTQLKLVTWSQIARYAQWRQCMYLQQPTYLSYPTHGGSHGPTPMPILGSIPGIIWAHTGAYPRQHTWYHMAPHRCLSSAAYLVSYGPHRCLSSAAYLVSYGPTPVPILGSIPGIIWHSGIENCLHSMRNREKAHSDT